MTGESVWFCCQCQLKPFKPISMATSEQSKQAPMLSDKRDELPIKFGAVSVSDVWL